MKSQTDEGKFPSPVTWDYHLYIQEDSTTYQGHLGLHLLVLQVLDYAISDVYID